jgi:hypothetical protein
MIRLVDSALIEALAGFIGMEDQEITLRTVRLLTELLGFFPSPDLVREDLVNLGCLDALAEMLDAEPEPEVAEAISAFMAM